MIKSRYFWIGAILFAIVPMLVVDIFQHWMDWQKDVRSEIISVVQNTYSFDRQQKADILDRVFERNQWLTFFIYIKSFGSLVLLGSSLFLFRIYRRRNKVLLWKPFVSLAFVVVSFLVIKIFWYNEKNSNAKIKFLELLPGEYSLQKLYDENLRGKVVYVDFWGTTCGPCLQEFRDFTRPLKEHYKSNRGIAYLYISQGNRYLWKHQIRKYEVAGYHVFLDSKQYENLFRNAAGNNKEGIVMPRYMIIDKNGTVVVTMAKQPSDRDSLFSQLDKYVADQ